MTNVQSVRSAVRIMELLAEEPLLGISDVARRLDLPKASTFRIIHTLADSGWLEEEFPDSRRWRVATTFGVSFVRPTGSFSEVAQQAVNAVRDETGETTHVLVPSGAALMVVFRAESRQDLRTTLAIGARVPWDASSSGAVYLACLLPAERERILGDPEALLESPGDLAHLHRNIDGAVDHGFAVTQGRWRPGIGGVAAPIRDGAGHPVGAIAISYPLSRVPEFSPWRAGELLVRHARVIEQGV